MGGPRIRPIRVPTSVAQLAYLAGIIDGEGSIVIVDTKPEKTSTKSYHSMRLCIANTNAGLMWWLQGAIGGRVGVQRRKNRNAKPAYIWEVCGRNAGLVLLAVTPYLQLKQAQASLALQFVGTLAKQRGRVKVLSPNVLAERRQLRDAVMAHNKRGIA